jgi:DeoR family fructose operon transcriptional repressor
MTSDQGNSLRDLQPASARQTAILGTLRARGQVRAVTMADELGVTHETIRKDLLTLESHGLLRRVHGGAVLAESLSFEPTISARTSMAAEKQRIAAAAIEFLPPTGAVLIDSGTTTEALAASLPPGVSLVAITNALPIALALMSHPQLTVHLLGGRIRTATLGTVDSWALRNLHDVQADVAFVGANAFTVEHGLSTPDSSEAALKGAMVESARLTVLMADHTKFGRDAVFKYADLEAVDILITDEGMSAADAHALQSAGGIEVLRV